MRREGYIIEEIIDYSNMSESFDEVLRGKKRKRSRQGRYLLAHREEVIKELTEQIANGSFRVSGYRERTIHEYGKERNLQILSMKDRIGVHAIMSVVDRHLQRRYIRTTAASIKERGTHDLMKEFVKICSTTQKARYMPTSLTSDISMRMFVKTSPCGATAVCSKTRMLVMLESFVTMLDSGISFGLRSSQATGNLLLSVFLDHYLKDKCGVAHFYRYCDDGLVLGKTKAELWVIREIIHSQVNQIDLEIKPNERVFPVDEGIDFLGYVIYPDHVAIRKRIKQKFARKMHEVKSRKRRRELIASFYGMTKHADCNRLFNKLTGKTMRSFKDLNVSYKPADGKKRFPGSVVSIRELVNLPIIVKDFELGIKTEQGEDRCIVSIEQNGEAKKFFTNSEEMKNILQQISELPDGLPFETTIRTETFGKGRTKYVFS